MGIVLNPITLPASKMIATMTSLITDVRFSDTIAPSDIVNELVNSCRIGKVDYGKGIVNTTKLDLQPVNDLSETSSAFSINKPQVAQETIEIDTYKVVPISFSSILTADAVTSGDLLSSFYAFVMSLLDDTTTFHLYDVCNTLYQDWVPGQASQTIEIDQIDTTDLTGEDLNSAIKWNANNIAKVMRKTMNNMKVLNSKYTDVATYVNSKTQQATPVKTALRGSDLKTVFNDKYMTNIMADSLATLYHENKVGDMIPGENIIVLPEDAMASKNANVIAWVSDRKKFALADFYNVVLSLLDPSTTYNNTFEHFAYGAGVFKYLPGVKFVAKIVG